MAVACDVFDGVFFPRGVLGEILNLIESVSGGFPSYVYMRDVNSSNSQIISL